MWTTWWVWMAGALVLAILEVLSPAYIFLGFAMGAFAVGALLYFGAFISLSIPAILLIFAVVSLVSWLALRQIFGVKFEKVKTWGKEQDIND